MRNMIPVLLFVLLTTLVPGLSLGDTHQDERRATFQRVIKALIPHGDCAPGLQEWRSFARSNPPDMEMHADLATLILAAGSFGCFEQLDDKNELLLLLRIAALNEKPIWYLDPPRARDLSTQAWALHTAFGDDWLMKVAGEGGLPVVMAAADINLLCSGGADHPLFSRPAFADVRPPTICADDKLRGVAGPDVRDAIRLYALAETLEGWSSREISPYPMRSVYWGPNSHGFSSRFLS